MCDAFENILKKSHDKGLEEGKLQTLIELVSDSVISVADAAKSAGMSKKAFSELYNKSVRA